MGRKLFITATDTGAGKTFVTTVLIRLLLAKGVNAIAIKPVASGLSEMGVNEDVDQLLKAQQLSDPDRINLYTFSLPASPNIAAQAEKKQIEPAKLAAWCHQQSENTDLCLIEGIGGLMVPLNESYRVSDWICDMKGCGVVLVVGARLGCINHTLLTLEYLKQLDMTPAYIVINALDESPAAEQAEQSLLPWIPSESHLFTIPCQPADTDFEPLLNDMITGLLANN